MSSEQVIAPCPFCGGEASANSCRTSDKEYIRLNKRDTGYGVNCIECGVNNRGSIGIGYATPDQAIAAWNRRLSTPAAGGDDVQRWAMTTSGMRKQSKDGPYVYYADYAQLQARNAEQAAKIERRTDALTAWQKRAEAAEAKLTALLDGIEGLEKDLRAAAEENTGILGASLECQADRLQALREPSVPAIGEP